MLELGTHYSVAMDAEIAENKARKKARCLVINPNSWALCPVQGDLGFSTLGTVVVFSKYPSGEMCKTGLGMWYCPSHVC